MLPGSQYSQYGYEVRSPSAVQMFGAARNGTSTTPLENEVGGLFASIFWQASAAPPALSEGSSSTKNKKCRWIRFQTKTKTQRCLCPGSHLLQPLPNPAGPASPLKRSSPFAPIMGAIARRDVSWRGYCIPEGTLVALDLYGTNTTSESGRNLMSFIQSDLRIASPGGSN